MGDRKFHSLPFAGDIARYLRHLELVEVLSNPPKKRVRRYTKEDWRARQNRIARWRKKKGYAY